MLEGLKNQLASEDMMVEGSIMMQEMAEAPEDEVFELLAIPDTDDKETLDLLDKIPDDDFVSDEKITDAELAKAADDTPDPTIDELLEEL